MQQGIYLLASVQRYAVRAFLYACTLGQFVPKRPVPAADPRRSSVLFTHPHMNRIHYNCIGAFDVPPSPEDPGGRYYHGNKKGRSTRLRPGTGCSMNFVGNKKAECPLQDTQIL